MNINKTKYLCITGSETNIKLENREEITACSVYKYLGVRISNNGTDIEKIKHRIGQGKRAIED